MVTNSHDRKPATRPWAAWPGQPKRAATDWPCPASPALPWAAQRGLLSAPCPATDPSETLLPLVSASVKSGTFCPTCGAAGCRGQSARRDRRNRNQSADEQRHHAEDRTGNLAAIDLRLAEGAHDSHDGADQRGYRQGDAQPWDGALSGKSQKESGIGKHGHQGKQQCEPGRPVALASSCFRHMRRQSSRIAGVPHPSTALGLIEISPVRVALS